MNRPLILHVEDDPNDVFLFGRAFKKAGLLAELRAFEDGDDLITFLSGLGDSGVKLPSLLMLDIKLPRKSGFEVLAWLRAHATFRYLPVLMLTSSAQPQDVRRAYEAGANGYLVKPMDMDEAVKLFSAISQFWLGANVSPFNAPLAPAQAAPG